MGAWGRDHSPVDAADGVDILFIATPDDVVAEVAAQVRPVPTTVVDWDQAGQRWLEPAIKMVITR